MEVDKLSFNEGLAAKLQNLTQQGSKIIAALIHGNHVFDLQTLKPPKTVFDLTNGFKSKLRDLEIYDSDGDRCLGPEDCKQDIYYIRGLPTETGFNLTDNVALSQSSRHAFDFALNIDQFWRHTVRAHIQGSVWGDWRVGVETTSIATFS